METQDAKRSRSVLLCVRGRGLGWAGVGGWWGGEGVCVRGGGGCLKGGHLGE